MTEDDDDARLARRIASGDPSAESTLFGRLAPRVHTWANLRVRNDAAQAADLAQHVLLVILEALRAGRVEDTDRLGAFLHGACTITLVSWRRGERRRGAILEAFGPTFLGISSADDEAFATINDVALDQKLDRERLAECFQHLANRAQSILTLTFFADRSSDEIAKELAISVANVRVLRHRALHELHDCVAGVAPGHA